MDAVPGQIFAVLTDADVGLFRADVRVVEAMLERWMASVAPTTSSTPAFSTSVPTG